MSSLACHLAHLGVQVSGSDKSLDGCAALLRQGITVFVGHNASNLAKDTQLVVRSQAIEESNCEVQQAVAWGIPVVTREQLLGQIFNGYERRVAVCGTHGKTTVTAMIDYVLRNLGVEHTAFVGGFACDSNSNYTFGKGLVVAEACEYKGSFFNLFPTLAVALNVEYDHPDCFENLQHVQRVFEQFFAKLPPRGLLLAHCSLPQNLLVGKNYVTFGDSECYYHANDVLPTHDGFCFNFCKGAKRYPARLS
ncbi:MAG: UDP-N-acetylmuramate--L-alanine ligase, partial [Clostridia bacterium]|nr:UDP-N-acetylmuramate--L-alanine ligase [Clostridia bacterium]